VCFGNAFSSVASIVTSSSKLEQDAEPSAWIVPIHVLLIADNATGAAFEAAVGHDFNLAVLEPPTSGRTTNDAGFEVATVANCGVYDADMRMPGINAITVLKQFFFDVNFGGFQRFGIHYLNVLQNL
jgi:hypothetical protein